MIEVEKKFQPTEDQMKMLLEGATFLGEVVNHDIYYDYPDYRFFKQGVRLRDRNGKFELKLGKSDGVAEELETDEEIKNYLKTDKSVLEFLETNLHPVVDYKTVRQKYKKNKFTIDVDKLDFGFNVCEIELLVDNDEDIEQAENKIMDLARNCNLEVKKLPSKRGEYLRLFKPDAYKELGLYSITD